MAKLSAQGNELGRIDYLKYTMAYFDNGKVLINRGNGWKVFGKIKKELSPMDAFNKVWESHMEFLKTHLAYAEYLKELISVGHSDRYWLHHTITTMPDDPDGVWGECCDGYGRKYNATMSDINRLCQLYKNMVEETKYLKGETNVQ